MGLFDLFKKKKREVSIDDALEIMRAFSTQPIENAVWEINRNGTFQPFGAILTNKNELQLIVYAPEQPIDTKEHASIIQKVIAKRFDEKTTQLAHYAFDGTAHLTEGDHDAICVRVSHKEANLHQIHSYLYIKDENGIATVDMENPRITNMK
jgi:hypothetical protein